MHDDTAMCAEKFGGHGLDPSHLLLTWADVLDEEWHLQALLELSRVARQVCVFPLVVQGTGAPVPFLPRILDRLCGDGHRVEVTQVRYEFQRGANQMLTLENRTY